jgi:hypothetical protein
MRGGDVRQRLILLPPLTLTLSPRAGRGEKIDYPIASTADTASTPSALATAG